MNETDNHPHKLQSTPNTKTDMNSNHNEHIKSVTSVDDYSKIHSFTNITAKRRHFSNFIPRNKVVDVKITRLARKL